jgi:protein-S-isoprenylcysteine O-methyltransferase Ste14
MEDGQSRAPYDRVEGLHLRQWALRLVPPLAILATNGAGFVALPALPAWDAPLRACGAPPALGTVVTLAGGASVAAAAVLRVLAKGVLVRKATVTRTGAYAAVRHPFYLANLLGAVGTFALAGPLGALVAVAWLAAALPIYLVTIDGEEQGLRRLHGPAWDEYAARVPRLVPRGLPSRGVFAGMTWRNLVDEGEPPRCLRFLAGAVVVLACRLGDPWTWPVAAAGGTLWALSHVVPRSAKRTKEC